MGGPQLEWGDNSRQYGTHIFSIHLGFEIN